MDAGRKSLQHGGGRSGETGAFPILFHAVGRQVDGATPQPVQKMTFEGLLHFVAKQKRLAGEVYTCYEAD